MAGYSSLQQHVDMKHSDLLMADKSLPTSCHACPMCDMLFTNTQQLTSHVESHFTVDNTLGTVLT